MLIIYILQADDGRLVKHKSATTTLASVIVSDVSLCPDVFLGVKFAGDMVNTNLLTTCVRLTFLFRYSRESRSSWIRGVFYYI